MKYTTTLMITYLAVVLIGGIVFTANEVMAKVGNNVQAVCSVCHTMHHSQDGTNPTHGWGAGTSAGPNTALLYGNTGTDNNTSCVACHAGSSSVHANGYDTATGAPQVDLAEASLLAGGTYVNKSDDAKIHNVLGIADARDSTLDESSKNVPPGGANTDIGGAAQITCAGTTGCHGDRSQTDNAAAVQGAHHAVDTTLDGSSVGKSYRFLSTDVVSSAFSNSGVDGLEHLTWESGRKNTISAITAADPNDHNVYDAVDINKVCASCHSNFHGTGDGGDKDGQQFGTGAIDPDNPWLRHPTDITLTAASTSGPSDEYDDYPFEGCAGTDNYSTEAPVGYANGQLGTAAAKLQGQVLCISCHRAHGSEWDDILRWNYSDMKATTGTGSVNTGCNRCHTTK